MSKVLRYVVAYGMWLVDLALSVWLFVLSRSALVAFLARSYQQGDFRYSKMAKAADEVFTVLLGIGWLGLIILTEEYYRRGAIDEGLTKRFARVTGPILLVAFVVDLLLFWLQGFGGAGWLRWLILAAELVLGVSLVRCGRRSASSEEA